MAVPERIPTMSQSKDDKALAKAKDRAMNQFLRDYDEYCDWKRRSLDTDVHQLALELKMADDD